MDVLLDTHMILWALTDDTQLSDKAREIILNDANNLYYSMVSVWEVAIKHINKPKQMLLDDEEFVKGCKMAGFLRLAIDEKHIAALKQLKRERDNVPEHHDPFDRLLISQAKSEGFLFLTHDSLLPYYNEECIVFA